MITRMAASEGAFEGGKTSQETWKSQLDHTTTIALRDFSKQSPLPNAIAPQPEPHRSIALIQQECTLLVGVPANPFQELARQVNRIAIWESDDWCTVATVPSFILHGVFHMSWHVFQRDVPGRKMGKVGSFSIWLFAPIELFEV